MKRFSCILGILSMVISVAGQTPTLNIMTDKTLSLVFPFTIQHVDRGTRDLLVQAIPEAGHILLVKAAVPDFHETTLSVLTEDGRMHTFLVHYGKPQSWVYYVPVEGKAPVALVAQGLLDNGRTVKGIRSRKWGMEASVKGIYIRENVLFYQMELFNNSSIDYDLDYLRFSIKDKQQGKRTAAQEAELDPIYTAGNKKRVCAGARVDLVIALPKFTIPEAQYLAIEIGEKGGGRHLALRVKNKDVIKARML